MNEGVCNPIVGQCICPSGFTGVRCETALSKDPVSMNERRTICFDFSD